MRKIQMRMKLILVAVTLFAMIFLTMLWSVVTQTQMVRQSKSFQDTLQYGIFKNHVNLPAQQGTADTAKLRNSNVKVNQDQIPYQNVPLMEMRNQPESNDKLKQVVKMDIPSDSQVTNTQINSDGTYVYFTDKFPMDKEPLISWVKAASKSYCDNKVTMFGGRFAIGRDVVMYPLHRGGHESQAKGGEQIKDVLNQNLQREDYNFNNDFWELDCSSNDITSSTSQQFYWSTSIKVKLITSTTNQTRVANRQADFDRVTKYTIGVKRQDYANLHNWVRNIYNTFLIMAHLNIQPSQVSIVFLDGHPFSYLDKAWEVIFDAPVRVGHLTKPVLYDNFIWGFQENKGPITEMSEQEGVPYLEEFRQFLLSRFHLDTHDKLDCNRLRVTLIVRRDAIYHPRNTVGAVGRKIFNEAEIVSAIIKVLPNADIRTVLMESLPMKSQLEISSTTDIWIGMHGAGMSHTIFLPKHAAVLELFERNFKTNRPWFICFHSITKWRGMKYDTWENFDKAAELPNSFTIVPPDVIANKTLDLAKQICGAN